MTPNWAITVRKMDGDDELGKALIPWQGPANLLPERSRQNLAVIRENVAVLSANRTVRTLSSGVVGLFGTLAIALMMITAEESPARSSQSLSSGAGDAPVSHSFSQQANRYLNLAAEMDSVASGAPVSLGGGATAHAAPFFFSRVGADRTNASDCLATAGWYEAGDDPKSQRSVMQVVLNRVQHPDFPNSICAVVFQGAERTTGCQFSFTCDGSMSKRFPSAAHWTRAKRLSEMALSGSVDHSVRQATHFHADYVSPWWRGSLQEVGRVGRHIFYRWPGRRGTLTRQGMRTEREASLGELALTATAPRMVAEAVEPGTDIARSEVAALNATHRPQAPVSSAGGSDRHRQVVHFGSQSLSGRWAVDSMKMCSGRADCRIVGFGSSGEAQANQSRAPAAMDRPLFIFARDSASGMDLALWDCGKVKRSRPEECLPQSSAEIVALIR